MTKSIEEQIEDWAKRSLNAYSLQYLTKTEHMDSEIDDALKTEESKKGDNGGNYPDIKLFIEIDSVKVPVMIECKGTKGDLCKLDGNGEPLNKKKDGTNNITNISKYAVNGAVHYATAIFKYADSYSRIIAIGINGYKNEDDTIHEVSAWLISKKNFGVPKKIGDYTDLSFLAMTNRNALSLKLKDILLTDTERERMAYEFENTIEANLKTLNQSMHDDLHIAVGDRVELIAAMIMAGLGVKDEDGNVLVNGLTTSDLRGEKGRKNHDGYVIYNKVAEFLDRKNLPDDKRESIKNTLERVLLHFNLQEARPVKDTNRKESRLKTVYREVEQNIMPIFLSAEHLDFTGKLFNVLNEWVDIPDGERNDVVLTPRYVTEFMAKLAEVNMNSYVWDYAAGSGGFLISAMKLMLKDAEQQYRTSPEKYADKVSDIKKYQLLGCEIRPDIYLLAVLNMILMKDGSATILNVDSLEKFSGTYEQGERKGKEFPANVFLLNPPYSDPGTGEKRGKGFIFVEKALKRMKSGKACVLIQENAGSGMGLPYTKNLLKNNTLIASIHMADIFRGKASVQTAVYLFEVGKPHDVDKYVKFIDFSDDGYTRQNRKKSSQEVNLRDTGNALERYQEVVDLVLNRKKINDCTYITKDVYIENKITDKGDDWTFKQHTVIDLTPTDIESNGKIKYDKFKTYSQKGYIPDFKYMQERITELEQYLIIAGLDDYKLTKEENLILIQSTIKKKFALTDIFDIKNSHNILKSDVSFKSGKFPYITASKENNGVMGYINHDTTMLEHGNRIFIGGKTMTINYQEYDFFSNDSHNLILTLKDQEKQTKGIQLFMVTALYKSLSPKYIWNDSIFYKKIQKDSFYLPIKIDDKTNPVIDIECRYHKNGFIPDFDYMEKYIRAIQKKVIADVVNYKDTIIKYAKKVITE